MRIQLSDALLSQVVHCAGSGSPLSGSPGSGRQAWGPLEQALHETVYREVPAAARRVRLAWDAAACEVVARFELVSLAGDPSDGGHEGSARER